MSIGIFSGSFDPFTKGHQWVAEQASKLFDKLHIVVGPNPSKKPYFTEEHRILMITWATEDLDVYVGPQIGKNVVEYAHLVSRQNAVPMSDIKLVRGVRNDLEFSAESHLANATRNLCPELDTILLYPPQKLRGISSSLVRDNMDSGAVDEFVPPEVLEQMSKILYPNNQWLVEVKPVASIFETSTAGFAPSPNETFTSSLGKGRLNKSSSRATPRWKKSSELESMRTFFKKMAQENFIRFAGTVTADEVRKMLDPFPYDVVVSQRFHLRQIPIRSVKPTGTRYLAESRSLGPIIVDANEVLIDTPYGKDLGPAIVIEGKHRWLDAVDRGDPSIWAWVGEKALPFVEAK